MTALCISICFLAELIVTSAYRDSPGMAGYNHVNLDRNCKGLIPELCNPCHEEVRLLRVNGGPPQRYERKCLRVMPRDVLRVIQGEGLRCPCANYGCSQETNHSRISWFRNTEDGMQEIPTDEGARVHHHGPVLYILPLSLNDTGDYITHWWVVRENVTVCNELVTHIEVSEEFHTGQVYLNRSLDPGPGQIICPVCEHQEKTLTWYKDFHLIPGQSEDVWHISNFSQNDVGIYTCLCTWEHNGIKYNTSGSSNMTLKEPTTTFPTTILYPKNMSVELVDLGSRVELNCSVFFGINVKRWCSVKWFRKNISLDGVKGYTVQERDQDSFQSILTIHEVSETDLQSEFHCRATGLHKWNYVIVTLRLRGSVLPLAAAFLSAFLILLLAVGITKWCVVDLALFFRGLGLTRNRRNDGKVYDAYVIYQKDDVDERTEKKMAHFIHKVLPAVLENSCGYKLYIHGRDDLPGEDRMELIEKRMQLSRRLIVVLTPGVETPAQGYDWQVGLHRVLVQQEMSMILIQLGEMEYSHLPLGLQHVLQKTPPLKWNEGSRLAASPSSRFWKQVRYRMPVVPAQKFQS